jgi:hypothetical protein
MLAGRLLRAFSPEDEVPGSSPGRPTTPLLTSENTRPLVRGLSQLGSSLVSNKIGGPTTPVSPHGHPDQHVRRLRGGFLNPRGRSNSGRRAHYFTSCRVGRTLREWRRGATRPRVDLCEPLPAVDRSRPSSRTDHQSSSTGPPRWAWRRPRPGCPRRAWQGRWTHGRLRRSVLASGHGPSGGASPPLRCRGCSRPCPQPRARPASSVNRSLR